MDLWCSAFAAIQRRSGLHTGKAIDQCYDLLLRGSFNICQSNMIICSRGKSIVYSRELRLVSALSHSFNSEKSGNPGMLHGSTALKTLRDFVTIVRGGTQGFLYIGICCMSPWASLLQRTPVTPESGVLSRAAPPSVAYKDQNRQSLEPKSNCQNHAFPTPGIICS